MDIAEHTKKLRKGKERTLPAFVNSQEKEN
jgi:hypothetical protein